MTYNNLNFFASLCTLSYSNRVINLGTLHKLRCEEFNGKSKKFTKNKNFFFFNFNYFFHRNKVAQVRSSSCRATNSALENYKRFLKSIPFKKLLNKKNNVYFFDFFQNLFLSFSFTYFRVFWLKHRQNSSKTLHN